MRGQQAVTRILAILLVMSPKSSNTPHLPQKYFTGHQKDFVKYSVVFSVTFRKSARSLGSFQCQG